MPEILGMAPPLKECDFFFTISGELEDNLRVGGGSLGGKELEY